MVAVDRSGYRRPAACDRQGAAGVALFAAMAIVALTWHWSQPPAISSARPAPRLSVFDVAPASPQPMKPNPKVESPPSPVAPAPPLSSTLPPPSILRLPVASQLPTASNEPSPQSEARTVPATPASPPAVAAPPAAKPVTAANPAAERSARANWQGDLLAHLRPLLRYPRMAQSTGQQGVTLVAVAVERSGAIRSVRIARGSGYPVLDQEAVATVKRGAPLPAPTADIPGDPVAVELPIQFSLRG